MNRPLSVTVIAWVIIATSVEGLITLLGGIATPIFTSGTVQTGMSVSASLWGGGIVIFVNLILALLILAGFGWARIVYVAILAIGLLGSFLHGPLISLILISGLKLAVFGYFLFHRESNEYFAKSAGCGLTIIGADRER
jgi:hypothetical protein